MVKSNWYHGFGGLCDGCGKRRIAYIVHKCYFNTYDGYDYLDSTECWMCFVKGEVMKRLRKVAKLVKRVGFTFKWTAKSRKLKNTTLFWELSK